MTPEDVVHPRTLRDFAVALKDGVDESGRFKTGIALDFTPFQWFVRDQTMARYLRLDSGDLDIDSLRADANKTTEAQILQQQHARQYIGVDRYYAGHRRR